MRAVVGVRTPATAAAFQIVFREVSGSATRKIRSEGTTEKPTGMPHRGESGFDTEGALGVRPKYGSPFWKLLNSVELLTEIGTVVNYGGLEAIASAHQG